MLHHLAHLNKFASFVKKGAKIKRGNVIGEVGNTGTTYAHLHYEVMRVKPDRWTQYVYDSTGRPFTEAQFDARYTDPNEWIDKAAKIPAPYTSMAGWEYKDKINRAGAFHGGVDINDGYGNQDLGNPVKSPVDGTIVYVGKLDGGWGNHLWIQEERLTPEFDHDLAQRLAGRFLLQVEAKGEIWYVHPEGQKEYIGGTPAEMLEFVEKNALGITNSDLNKIPTK